MTAAALDVSSPVGVIAGGGAMPFAVADSLKARGLDPVLFALKGVCDPAAAERFRHHWITVGQYGRAKKLFREENCKNLVFIGTLVRPSLSEIRLDWGTLRIMGRVWSAYRGGDDHLLSGVGRIFEQDGFRLLGLKEVAPDLLMPEGCVTRKMPDQNAMADIARGREVLRALGPFDIGQAAVVIDGHVVGVEGIEGTDELLKRIADLRARWPHSRAGRPRRAGESAKERTGLAFRFADGGIANRRGGRRGRTCGPRRHCRQHGRRRSAGHDRGGGRGWALRHRFAFLMPGPANGGVARKIFLIATEESGDRLGAHLMKVLRQRLGGAVMFEGVGGLRDDTRGIEVPVSDRGAVDHRLFGRRQAASQAAAFDPSNDRCGVAGRSRYSHHHR